MKKSKKLYACGTTWTWDFDTSNSGDLKFYTSVKALKQDNKCWEECGIVEIDVSNVAFKYIVKPQPITSKSVKFLGAQILNIAKKTGSLRAAKEALYWALDMLLNNKY